MNALFDPSVTTCIECGFDVGLWDVADATRTIRHAADFVDLACESMRPELLAQHPPNPGSESIATQIDALSQILSNTRHAVVEHPNAQRRSDDRLVSLFERMTRLDREADLTVQMLRDQLAVQPKDSARLADGGRQSIELTASHLAHAVLHHQAGIAATRIALGDTVKIGTGEVVQISGSGGGLPKVPLLGAVIDKRGVVGDRQATRRHHGAPFQALCLFSAEVIDAFAAQGHPIGYGSTGENITVRGLDWAELRAGLEIQIGVVRCRLTAPAVPCSQNARWFSDGDFSRLSHVKHPGQSRWYASVLTEGTVNPGDEVYQAA